MSEKLPNFLVIGAAKAGTTSLNAWLHQHPSVFLPESKESNFFALEGVDLNQYRNEINEAYRTNLTTEFTAYRRIFRQASHHQSVGEICPSYLFFPQAAQRIKTYLGSVKILAILRNPVDRAYSHFLHHVREGFEEATSFEEAAFRTSQKNWWGYQYLAAGLYAQQLAPFFRIFPPDCIKVLLYDDLQKNNSAFLGEVLKFLELQPAPIAWGPRQNVTGTPRSKLLQRILCDRNSLPRYIARQIVPKPFRSSIFSAVANSNLVKPALDESVKKKLLSYFKKDLQDLEKLINRNLSSWFT